MNPAWAIRLSGVHVLQSSHHTKEKIMNTVTYITDANAGRYLIVDYHYETVEEWFKQSLPSDESKELRQALIDATVRMYGEDRALLAANGFEINEIPLSYAEAINTRVFDEGDFADGSRDVIYNEIAAECELQGLTKGHADIWATLNVLKAIGGNVEKFLN